MRPRAPSVGASDDQRDQGDRAGGDRATFESAACGSLPPACSNGMLGALGPCHPDDPPGNMFKLHVYCRRALNTIPGPSDSDRFPGSRALGPIPGPSDRHRGRGTAEWSRRSSAGPSSNGASD